MVFKTMQNFFTDFILLFPQNVINFTVSAKFKILKLPYACRPT